MFCMGTITVNVNDDVEKKFRKRVAQRYGKRKGALGRALAEAMQDWVEKENSTRDVLRMLDEGLDLGGFSYKDREELHDRN